MPPAMFLLRSPNASPLPAALVHRAHSGRLCVKDAAGQPVAYTYGDDSPQGAGSHQMTVDEARRVAANIAKLPELLGAQTAAGSRALPGAGALGRRGLAKAC